MDTNQTTSYSMQCKLSRAESIPQNLPRRHALDKGGHETLEPTVPAGVPEAVAVARRAHQEPRNTGTAFG